MGSLRLSTLSNRYVSWQPLVEALLCNVWRRRQATSLHDETSLPLQGAEGTSLVPTGWHHRAIYARPRGTYSGCEQFWGRAVRTNVPKTQACVWDVFATDRGEKAGTCPTVCANPKGCTSFANMTPRRRIPPSIELSTTIQSGYADIGICKIVSI